ncbi:MAG TPA: hypothetical protein VMJ10_18130 [Kofleriaceae bacterium]|nr:hypothetical protein [Kofleriaceae bacterium]
MAIGFAGKRGIGWVLVAGWLIPAIMCGAYLILMSTSDTDTSGKIWEGIGLAFVLCLWFLFRTLTRHAAMARAVAVGDATRVLELADRQSAKMRSLYRALAFQIRGAWPQALEELDRRDPPASKRVLAATVRVAALVETGRAADARAVFDRDLARRSPTADIATASLVRLAEARVRWAEGDLGGADKLLARLVDDVRAGENVRAIAHGYAARIADSRGDAAAAAKHRARAAELAPRSAVA